MQVVWAAGDQALTVRDVVERLPGPAYTTVQTMMNILVRKGALRSAPGSGRALEYRSRLTREAATSSMTSDFVERLFGGSARPQLNHLLEHESLDRVERRLAE